MLRLKRECFSNRSSSWIQATTPCRRTTFNQSFIPGKRYSSTNASDTARLQRSGNLKDDLPAAWSFWFAGAVCLGTIGVVEWKRSEPFRHTVHAAVRCSRVARMIILFRGLVCALTLPIIISQVLRFSVPWITNCPSQSLTGRRKRVSRRIQSVTNAVLSVCSRHYWLMEVRLI